MLYMQENPVLAVKKFLRAHQLPNLRDCKTPNPDVCDRIDEQNSMLLQRWIGGKDDSKIYEFIQGNYRKGLEEISKSSRGRG